jgi:hypothetical protein
MAAVIADCTKVIPNINPTLSSMKSKAVSTSCSLMSIGLFNHKKSL